MDEGAQQGEDLLGLLGVWFALVSTCRFRRCRVRGPAVRLLVYESLQSRPVSAKGTLSTKLRTVQPFNRFPPRHSQIRLESRILESSPLNIRYLTRLLDEFPWLPCHKESS